MRTDQKHFRRRSASGRRTRRGRRSRRDSSARRTCGHRSASRSDRARTGPRTRRTAHLDAAVYRREWRRRTAQIPTRVSAVVTKAPSAALSRRDDAHPVLTCGLGNSVSLSHCAAPRQEGREHRRRNLPTKATYSAGLPASIEHRRALSLPADAPRVTRARFKAPEGLHLQAGAFRTSQLGARGTPSVSSRRSEG